MISRLALLIMCACMQVDCTPPDNIVVDVRQARLSQGGFLQLALEQVRDR